MLIHVGHYAAETKRIKPYHNANMKDPHATHIAQRQAAGRDAVARPRRRKRTLHQAARRGVESLHGRPDTKPASIPDEWRQNATLWAKGGSGRPGARVETLAVGGTHRVNQKARWGATRVFPCGWYKQQANRTPHGAGGAETLSVWR